MFVALATAAILAAEEAEAPPAPPPREWVVISAHASAVITRPFAGVPLSAGGEAAFVIVPPARVFLAAGGVVLERLPPRAVSAPSQYFMGGAEGVLTTLLPIELMLAAAVGATQVYTCLAPGGSTNGCPLILQVRTMIRASVGYQVHRLFSAGVVLSWNALPGFVGGQHWFESGLRVSLHL